MLFLLVAGTTCWILAGILGLVGGMGIGHGTSLEEKLTYWPLAVLFLVLGWWSFRTALAP